MALISFLRDLVYKSAGKLFAGLYALYCGLALIFVADIIFAPVVHHVLHKFHLDQKRP